MCSVQALARAPTTPPRRHHADPLLPVFLPVWSARADRSRPSRLRSTAGARERRHWPSVASRGGASDPAPAASARAPGGSSSGCGEDWDRDLFNDTVRSHRSRGDGASKARRSRPPGSGAAYASAASARRCRAAKQPPPPSRTRRSSTCSACRRRRQGHRRHRRPRAAREQVRRRAQREGGAGSDPGAKQPRTSRSRPATQIQGEAPCPISSDTSSSGGFDPRSSPARRAVADTARARAVGGSTPPVTTSKSSRSRRWTATHRRRFRRGDYCGKGRRAVRDLRGDEARGRAPTRCGAPDADSKRARTSSATGARCAIDYADDARERRRCSNKDARS